MTLCCDNRIARAPSLRDKGTALLAIVGSYWNRRAWTAFEGHMATNIHFMRENDLYNPFQVQQAIKEVLNKNPRGPQIPRERSLEEDPPAPLWLMSSIAELEIYTNKALTPECSGVFLSTRYASRPDDAELIWSLLVKPFRNSIKKPGFDPFSPFDFCTQIDSAFIFSNAQRSLKPGCCCMPGKVYTSKWIEYALGGQQATKIKGVPFQLRGECFRKTAVLENIDWPSTFDNLAANQIVKIKAWLNDPSYERIVVCPVWRVGSRKGRWKQAILMTRKKKLFGRHVPGHDQDWLPWHWETIVEFHSEESFDQTHIATLTLGCGHVCPPSPLLTTSCN